MTRITLVQGDFVPHFSAPTTTNQSYHFDTVAGRYIVLSFLGSLSLENSRSILHHAQKNVVYDDKKFCFFGVCIDYKDEPELKERTPGVRFFKDFDGSLSRLFGALPQQGSNVENGSITYSPFTLVLDPMLRIMHILPHKNAEEHNRSLDALLKSLPPLENYGGVPMIAPVLILPRVFEPKLCRMLIDHYNEKGGVDSGFMSEREGKTVGVYDYNFKRRTDCFLEDEGLKQAIRSRVARWIAPAIKQAFQFEATLLERYLIACYDGELGGHFRPHRDNTTKATAHRKFAVTINLNAEEYEGGDLVFPEFGPKTYRAPTGGAVVFSCSLLHQATPVTKGKRYACLPFLYDEQGGKVREMNQSYLSAATFDYNKPAA